MRLSHTVSIKSSIKSIDNYANKSAKINYLTPEFALFTVLLLHLDTLCLDCKKYCETWYPNTRYNILRRVTVHRPLYRSRRGVVVRLPFTKGIEQVEGRADADAGIRQVEGGPSVAGQKKIEKINYVAV